MSKFRKKAGVNGEIYPCKPDIFDLRCCDDRHS